MKDINRKQTEYVVDMQVKKLQPNWTTFLFMALQAIIFVLVVKSGGEVSTGLLACATYLLAISSCFLSYTVRNCTFYRHFFFADFIITGVFLIVTYGFLFAGAGYGSDGMLLLIMISGMVGGAVLLFSICAIIIIKNHKLYTYAVPATCVSVKEERIYHGNHGSTQDASDMLMYQSAHPYMTVYVPTFTYSYAGKEYTGTPMVRSDEMQFEAGYVCGILLNPQKPEQFILKD